MTDPNISIFSLTSLEKVISGVNAVGALATELDSRNASRVVIVTTKSLLKSTALKRLETLLGHRLVGTVAAASQHVPAEGVRQATAVLKDNQADAVVSFGGGSVIDATKAAVASTLNSSDMTQRAGDLRLSDAFGPRRGGAFLHISIPTTLSAGSFTPAGGVLDVETKTKHAIIDPRIQPAVVIHDATLTLETPRALWLSTGIRALDHAVEAIYSKRHHILSDALAAEAISQLNMHLLLSVGERPDCIEHRSRCLDAAWLSLYGGFNTGLGLSHALGHQIGPRWNVPHGITSCIALPHAMRFVAGLVPARFAYIAGALGIAFDIEAPKPGALACAQAVEQLIEDCGLPRSLREVGVARTELDSIAAQTADELTLFDAMDEPVTRPQIKALLETAYQKSPLSPRSALS